MAENKIIEIKGVKYKEIPDTNNAICGGCDYFWNNNENCELDVCPCGRDMILQRLEEQQ